jgi:hypothetical protein
VADRHIRQVAQEKPVEAPGEQLLLPDNPMQLAALISRLTLVLQHFGQVVSSSSPANTSFSKH